MFSKVWIINIFLMILLGIISVSIWDIWQKETGIIPDRISTETKTISPKKKSMARHRPQSKSEYDVIVDNNLFSSDRMANIQDVEEPLPETQETEEPVKIDGEKVVLYGVIMMNDYKKALINNPIRDKGNKEKLWIAEGDRVGNLNVKQISAEQILLSDGIKNYNVSLYDPKKQKRKMSKTKSGKSKAPQVIRAGDESGSSSRKAGSAKKKAERSRSASSDSRRNIVETKDGKFEIIETPFGKIKRRIK
ncbi:MAG: hypothetical protein ACKVE4_07935 [Dissulfuribacterales bacterium]